MQGRFQAYWTDFDILGPTLEEAPAPAATELRFETISAFKE